MVKIMEKQVLNRENPAYRLTQSSLHFLVCGEARGAGSGRGRGGGLLRLLTAAVFFESGPTGRRRQSTTATPSQLRRGGRLASRGLSPICPVLELIQHERTHAISS
jgi:hypothetical protein